MMLKVQRGRPKLTIRPQTPTETVQPTKNHENGTGYSVDAENVSNQSEPASDDVQPKKRGRKPGSVSTKADIERIRVMLSVYLSGTSALVSKVNQIDALIIESGAPNLINAICVLAEQDKNVRLFLLQLSITGAYGGVIMASLAIIVPILANHNLIPPLFQAKPQQPQSEGFPTNGVYPQG